MTIEDILEIGIDGKERLILRPNKERFIFVLRNATEVHFVFLQFPATNCSSVGTLIIFFIHLFFDVVHLNNQRRLVRHCKHLIDQRYNYFKREHILLRSNIFSKQSSQTYFMR